MVRQGFTVSKATVEKWRLAGMPSRDPDRWKWIERNRAKQLPDKPKDNLKARQSENRDWRDERDKFAAINEKYKAMRQKQNYETERGRLVPARVMMGVLKQHFRDSRSILMNLPDTLAGHITDMNLQLEIREAAMTVCSDAINAVVHAIREAAAAVGLRIALDDDRNRDTIPMDDEAAEDDAT